MYIFLFFSFLSDKNLFVSNCAFHPPFYGQQKGPQLNLYQTRNRRFPIFVVLWQCLKRKKGTISRIFPFSFLLWFFSRKKENECRKADFVHFCLSYCSFCLFFWKEALMLVFFSLETAKTQINLVSIIKTILLFLCFFLYPNLHWPMALNWWIGFFFLSNE